MRIRSANRAKKVHKFDSKCKPFKLRGCPITKAIHSSRLFQQISMVPSPGENAQYGDRRSFYEYSTYDNLLRGKAESS